MNILQLKRSSQQKAFFVKIAFRIFINDKILILAVLSKTQNSK